MCQAINVIIIEKVFCILCNQLIPIINDRIFSLTILYTQNKKSFIKHDFILSTESMWKIYSTA